MPVFRGRVLLAEGGLGLPGLTVTVVEGAGEGNGPEARLGSVLTDSRGRFEIRVELPPPVEGAAPRVLLLRLLVSAPVRDPAGLLGTELHRSDEFPVREGSDHVVDLRITKERLERAGLTPPGAPESEDVIARASGG